MSLDELLGGVQEAAPSPATLSSAPSVPPRPDYVRPVEELHTILRCLDASVASGTAELRVHAECLAHACEQEVRTPADQQPTLEALVEM